ncbi:MAG: bifunctional enoyl-CoA hydratase/phosphate acetyltransferase [Pseudorhodoferax sp.]
MQPQPELQAHPRLAALIARARAGAAERLPRIGLVSPCDALALDAARRIAASGIGQPVLIGPRAAIAQAAEAAGVDLAAMALVDAADAGAAAALEATRLARNGQVDVLMKGSLHTDALMSAVVHKENGLRGERRMSHVFLFDLPHYPKLLAMADCVVNIAPDLRTKQDILGNAVALLQKLGNPRPKVGIVAAVETVTAAIPATLDAQALVAQAEAGAWPGAIVEGPFGFDNVFSAEAARIKKIAGVVPGDADLLLVPDLNAGNMLYKSFVYVGGGDCAGLVLGARVPVVVTSRADSAGARIASVALAVLAAG